MAHTVSVTLRGHMYALIGPFTPADSPAFQGPDSGLKEGKVRAVDRTIE